MIIKLSVLLSIFLLLGGVSLAAQTTTVVVDGDDGYTFLYPLFDSLKINTPAQFHFHIFNKSNGIAITNKTAECHFHLYTQDSIVQGQHKLVLNHIRTFDNEFDFEVLVGGGNFSELGLYNYLFQCNGSNVGGGVTSSFLVTETGTIPDEAPTNYAFFFIACFVIAVLLSIASIYFKECLGASIGFGTFSMILFIFLASMLLNGFEPVHFAATIPSEFYNMFAVVLGLMGILSLWNSIHLYNQSKPKEPGIYG